MVLAEIVLGIVQGVFEWLPISSEGMLALISSVVFKDTLLQSVQLALFLHIGTLFSIGVFYWNDFMGLLKKPNSPLFRFLLVSSIFSGVAGLLTYATLSLISGGIGVYAMLLISVALVFTAYLQRAWHLKKHSTVTRVSARQAAIVGAAQGFALVPGISRSGITLSTLLMFNIEADEALRLSFMMSVPAVLMANIFLQFQGFSITPGLVIGAFVAFLVGLFTIKALTGLVKKISFWKVCLALAALNVVAVLVTVFV